MSEPLNNVTTADDYTPANTVEVNYPLARATIRVNNAAVYRQLLVGLDNNPRAARWQPELFVPPGQEKVQRRFLFGVRVRSAVAGTPAQVTIELVARGE